jgi:WD40 repeat protein
MLGLVSTKKSRKLAPSWKVVLDDYPTSVAFSPDGELCAIGASSGELYALDGTTGRLRWRTQANPRGVLGVAGSDRIVASCGQNGRTAVFGHDGAERAELHGNAPWVEHVAIAPGGTKIATASGKHVRIWNEDGTPFLETQAHPSTVTAIQWNRSASALATTCYGGAYLWDVAPGAKPRHFPFKGSLIALAWSPNEKVIACGSQDCSVHFWRLDSGKDSEMTGYPFKPKALAWDSGSSMLATGGDATVCVWDFARSGPEGTAPIQLETHKGQVTHLAFHPRKALLASAAQDMGIALWDPRTRTEPTRFAFVDDAIEALVWNPNGKHVVTADASGAITAWPGILR